MKKESRVAGGHGKERTEGDRREKRKEERKGTGKRGRVRKE